MNGHQLKTIFSNETKILALFVYEVFVDWKEETSGPEMRTPLIFEGFCFFWIYGIFKETISKYNDD